MEEKSDVLPALFQSPLPRSGIYRAGDYHLFFCAFNWYCIVLKMECL